MAGARGNSGRPKLEEASLVDVEPVELGPLLELRTHPASNGSGTGVACGHMSTRVQDPVDP